MSLKRIYETARVWNMDCNIVREHCIVKGNRLLCGYRMNFSFSMTRSQTLFLLKHTIRTNVYFKGQSCCFYFLVNKMGGRRRQTVNKRSYSCQMPTSEPGCQWPPLRSCRFPPRRSPSSPLPQCTDGLCKAPWSARACGSRLVFKHGWQSCFTAQQECAYFVTTLILTPNTPLCFLDGVLFKLRSRLVNFMENSTFIWRGTTGRG